MECRWQTASIEIMTADLKVASYIGELVGEVHKLATFLSFFLVGHYTLAYPFAFFSTYFLSSESPCSS